jgi:hypothetical protein
MAMNFTTIKNHGQETVIHFECPAEVVNGTITIANLTAATQARNTDAPRVNIVRLISTGEEGALIQIVRSTKTIIVCAPANIPILDLPSVGISDSQLNDQDIVIQNLAAKRVSGYIILRKVAGWSGKVETAEFGSYDNPSVVGS